MSALDLNGETPTGDTPAAGLSPFQLREWNAANSPFLSKLPAEIRIQIYDLVFADDRRDGNVHLISRDLMRRREEDHRIEGYMNSARSFVLKHRGRVYAHAYKVSKFVVAPPLLRTCHQLAMDGSPIFYTIKQITVLPREVREIRELICGLPGFYPGLNTLEVTDIVFDRHVESVFGNIVEGMPMVSSLVLSYDPAAGSSGAFAMNLASESRSSGKLDSLVIRDWDYGLRDYRVVGGYGPEVQRCKERDYKTISGTIRVYLTLEDTETRAAKEWWDTRDLVQESIALVPDDACQRVMKLYSVSPFR